MQQSVSALDRAAQHCTSLGLRRDRRGGRSPRTLAPLKLRYVFPGEMDLLLAATGLARVDFLRRLRARAVRRPQPAHDRNRPGSRRCERIERAGRWWIARIAAVGWPWPRCGEEAPDQLRPTPGRRPAPSLAPIDDRPVLPPAMRGRRGHRRQHPTQAGLAAEGQPIRTCPPTRPRPPRPCSHDDQRR